MRLFFSTIILFLFNTTSVSNENYVLELRNAFYKVSERKIPLEDFKKIVDKYEENESTIYKGYKSMYFMLLARKSWNPYTKYSCFLSGKTILEKVISIDPKNIELRYLRFCIQHEAPGLLNYKEKLKEDKEKILSGWNKILDQDLKEKIKIYFLENRLAAESTFN